MNEENQLNSDIQNNNINDEDISVNDFFDSVNSWEMMLAKKCTASCSQYSSSNRDTSCTF